MNCSCPKRANEQRIIERVGLDICCPIHGDPVHFKLSDEAMQRAREEIIQQPGKPQGITSEKS